jgi:hypothetical protein
MLDKKIFQDMIQKFYGKQNDDRTRRVCRVIYGSAFYLSVEEFNLVLDCCTDEYGYMHIPPKKIREVINKKYPYSKSIFAKMKRNKAEIIGELGDFDKCQLCENGLIFAKPRRTDIDGHIEQTFRCTCELGDNGYDIPIWNNDHKKKFIPRFEEFPIGEENYKIKKIDEILPGKIKKKEHNKNDMINHIYQQLGN